MLWIDAICINQSDIKEREEQVARMAHIYKRARRVVVWLGDTDEDHNGGLALRTMDYLGRQVVVTHDGWSFADPDADEPYWCEGGVPCRTRRTSGSLSAASSAGLGSEGSGSSRRFSWRIDPPCSSAAMTGSRGRVSGGIALLGIYESG